jgi:hypothetical protein
VGAALSLLIWAAATTAPAAPAELFQETTCDMIDGDVAFLLFEHKPDRQRTISFSNKGQMSAVYLGYFTDIAIDWPRIRGIYLSPAGEDPSKGMFSIDFDRETNIRPLPFKFGMVARSCFNDLRERYGQSLNFVDQTNTAPHPL